jgi:hypothetical protein
LIIAHGRTFNTTLQKRRKLPPWQLEAFFVCPWPLFGAEAAEVLDYQFDTAKHRAFVLEPRARMREPRALLPLGLFLLLSGFLLRHNPITSFLVRQMYARKNFESTLFFNFV